MAEETDSAKRSIGWMGLQRGHRARPLEWLAERGIFLVSLSAIVMVFLIFLFVVREALPFFSARWTIPPGKKFPVADMDNLTPAPVR